MSKAENSVEFTKAMPRISKGNLPIAFARLDGKTALLLNGQIWMNGGA